MGEAAAAHVAGALSLDDALRILCRRSILMRGLSGAGAMALVDLPAEDVTAELAGLGHKASIAAVNSRRSTVISGEKECITELVAGFNARGVFSRLVNVDVASHSPQMEEPSKALREGLSGSRRMPPLRSSFRPYLDAWSLVRNWMRLIGRGTFASRSNSLRRSKRWPRAKSRFSWSWDRTRYSVHPLSRPRPAPAAARPWRAAAAAKTTSASAWSAR